MPNDSTAASRSRVLRSPALRWVVPAGAVVVLAGGIAFTSANADAAAKLAPKTAAQLLADVAEAPQHPLSGTVVETARLGLPELPGQAAGTSLQSLITGSHTARVWYGTNGKARVSLVGDLAETDVVRNGTDVWLWSSQNNAATHYRLPAGEAGADAARRVPSAAVQDPASAAKAALAAIDPTTKVRVDGTGRVAGHAVYELRLAPRDARSLIGSVRIAVDGATSVPLRVQIFARGGTEPAFETGFTSVQFQQPAASIFRFTPPKGAKVDEQSLPSPAAHPDIKAPSGTTRSHAATRPGGAGDVIGKGWTSVAVIHGVDLGAVGDDPTANALLRATSSVSGPFGTGRLLKTPLVSVLIVGDTAYVGAVDPAVVEQAAASAATSHR